MPRAQHVDESLVLGEHERGDPSGVEVGRGRHAKVGAVNVPVAPAGSSVAAREAFTYSRRLLGPVLDPHGARHNLGTQRCKAQLLGEPVAGNLAVGVGGRQPQLTGWSSGLTREDCGEPGSPRPADVMGVHLHGARCDGAAVVSAGVEYGDNVHLHVSQGRVPRGDPHRGQARREQLLLIVGGDDDADGPNWPGRRQISPSWQATLTAPLGVRTSSRKSASSIRLLRGHRARAAWTSSPVSG